MYSATYQHLAERTMNPDLQGKDQLLNAGLGLCGESGEVADIIKKYVYHGHELDIEKLTKELGDIQWYIVQVCSAIGITLGDVMQDNIDKLKARYPEGFNSKDSLERKV